MNKDAFQKLETAEQLLKDNQNRYDSIYEENNSIQTLLDDTFLKLTVAAQRNSDLENKVNIQIDELQIANKVSNEKIESEKSILYQLEDSKKKAAELEVQYIAEMVAIFIYYSRIIR
jgi:hypothetical protein